MKKVILLLATGIMVVSMLTSCGVETFLYGYDESTARHLQPNLSGLITPMAADLEVQSERITHQKTFENKLRSSDISDPQNSGTIIYMRNITISEAVQKHNADVIVGPVVDILTSDDYDKITVTVYGYPACYKNFRKATADDIILYNKALHSGTKPEGVISLDELLLYKNAFDELLNNDKE